MSAANRYSAAQDVRGPRAVDRRKVRLELMRRDCPHFTEAEVIAVVDCDEWPAWTARAPRLGGNEGWYE